jgi:hypothetical protein
MINGIDSSASRVQMGSQMQMKRPNYKMTDEDKEKVSSILSNYDSSKITDESMQSMMEEIEAAGIKPGDDLMSMMDEAGFKPKEPPTGKGQGGPQGASSKGEMPEFLSDFVSKYQSGNVSDDDVASLVQQLQSKGMGSKGNIVDEGV